MNRLKPGAVSMVAALFLFVQIAGAQTSSPQPNRNSASPPGHPRRPIQRQMTTVHRSSPTPAVSYATAARQYHHQRHPRSWWRQHYTVIVLVGGGCYYFDSGYWFPAWGYDPSYESYDYDGPIFTYGNLLPDQVIINVQRALQDLGYFAGPISGSLSPATRRAISAFQQDNGLEINGVVDGPTVYALGLI